MGYLRCLKFITGLSFGALIQKKELIPSEIWVVRVFCHVHLAELSSKWWWIQKEMFFQYQICQKFSLELLYSIAYLVIKTPFVYTVSKLIWSKPLTDLFCFLKYCLVASQASLMYFLHLSSQPLVSICEEAYSSHKPNQHRAEPHWSSHWWDVQKGLGAQSALHNGRSGHDPTAA